MAILIDNGHGEETPGKRSPDGRLMEWKWARTLALRIANGLISHGADARLLAPESADVPLRQRVARANAYGKDAILVSIHANAAGRGDWMQARGWSAFVAQNASQKSMRLASLLAAEAERQSLKVRRPVANQDFWVQNLAICRDTICPAVLTENLFMDNLSDIEIMLSEDGMRRLANLHIEAILQYLNCGR